jgi:hypothetical protein
MGVIVQVRVHAVGAGAAPGVVVLRYGVEPAQERARLLKHAHKRAAARAWEREKALVAAGWEGRGAWTEEEKEELISHGVVDGWAARDVHSLARYRATPFPLCIHILKHFTPAFFSGRSCNMTLLPKSLGFFYCFCVMSTLHSFLIPT